MREYAAPVSVDWPAAGNLTDAVFDNANDSPDLVAFSRRSGGPGSEWVPVTAKEFADQVRGVAAGLLAAGIGAGDRVALMSKTRYEWTLVDYAIWTVGAVTVPVYETSSAEQVAWILEDSGAVAAVVETAEHAAVVRQVSDGLALRAVWQIEGDGLEQLTQAGRSVTYAEIEQRRRAVGPDDLATVIYTSGTTGRPKGCALTHGNFITRCQPVSQGLDELFNAEGSTLLFLPLAHIFARIIQVGAVLHRVRLGHTSDVEHLAADLAAFQPTFVLAVPRVFEKIYTGAQQKARADGAGAIFDAAAATAVGFSRALDGGGPGLALRAKHAVFDRLVYRKLRAAMGGRVRYAVSGGAPLGERLGHFFRGIGVTVLEGYGLTETTAGGTVNLPKAIKIGSIGRPIPGCTVRIAEDGEILLKAPFNFRGYWHNVEATDEAIDAEGWVRTGDIGALDGEGYLTITGRKKELIVTAGGKNVAPAVLEDRVRRHPLVSQCLVVGDAQPYVAALVTLDPEAFARWAGEHGQPADASVADLRDDPRLLAAVQEAVDDANAAVSQAESIRRFRILADDFSERTGELTPTLKIKRSVVLRAHADDVAVLYG